VGWVYLLALRVMGKSSKRKGMRRTVQIRSVEMSWAEIVQETRSLEDQWQSEGSQAWYRGHADASWELKPTLHREVERFLTALRKRPARAEEVVLLRSSYKKEYRSFRSAAWPLLDQRERSDWGIVFAMQHYGQITRLLDWSESLACAVYFALFRSCEKCDVKDRNAAIWMLDPQALNQESQGFDGVVGLDQAADVEKADGTVFDVRSWHPKYKSAEELKSIAVAPDFTNPRMTAQRAAFTVAGDAFEGLDHEFGSLVSGRRLVKFVITPEAKKDAAAFLSVAGLDAYSFFPDLHGLALRHNDDTRKKFELMKKWYASALK
jgi:hypothetical protein